jgi:hypothetical protein
MVGYIGYDNTILTPTTVTGFFDLFDQRIATIDKKWPFGGIVSDGLVLYLDAANKNSYPGSGSTWFDISGSNNHLTLINGPTLSSANGGVFQFNGINQYAENSLNLSTSNMSIIASSRYSGATRKRVISSVSNNWLLGHWDGQAEAYYAEGWITAFSGLPNDTNWRIFTATENFSSDQRSFYVNNSLRVSNSTAGANGFNGLSIGRSGVYTGEISTCEVGVILVYNRVLSTAELTQNFNALRGRYGI